MIRNRPYGSSRRQWRSRVPPAGSMHGDSLSGQASNVQYTIHDIPGTRVDDLCDILLMNGALSTSVSEYRNHGEEEQEIFKDGEFTNARQQAPEYWNRCRVQACFPIQEEDHDVSLSFVASVEESLQMLGMVGRITTETIRPQDWEKNIKDEYQVIQITESLWIVPSWDAERRDPLPVNNNNNNNNNNKNNNEEDTNGVTEIVLEPGLAFGTGDHPTTRLCLSWIHELSTQGIRTSKILDYGTGSGVLAIAALVMDVAAMADGTDIEPLSVKASSYNASLNNVQDRLKVYLVGQDGIQDDDGPLSTYDIIMANILQGPLIALAPTLASHRRPSGHTLLAVSGITRHQADDVIAAYSPWFTDFETILDDTSDWVCVTARSTHT